MSNSSCICVKCEATFPISELGISDICISCSEGGNNDKVCNFYILLKSKFVGRVINGTVQGCILEKELDELYEQYRSDS